MGENVPKIAKKFLKIVRVMCYMIRKGISKGKLLADLNIMMKRTKIAGKLGNIHNLMFHHHHHNANNSASVDDNLSYPVPLNEYGFSCSNTPAHTNFHLPFHLKKRKNANVPPSNDDVLMMAAFEMINSAAESPALPGFGSTPMVRQLRVTDSPFPLRDSEVDNHVDEAAEEFIMKFYKDLKLQSGMA